MKLVNRHKRCVGITIMRWNRWLLELWRCPVGEEVRPHRHFNQDSVLIFMSGDATIGKEQDGKKRELPVHGRWNAPVFHIPADMPHWVTHITRTLWFFNLSYTQDSRLPVESAAVNFQHI